MITDVEHFSFAVSDMDESLRFFCDLLGMVQAGETVDLEGEPVATITGVPDIRLRIAWLNAPNNRSFQLREYVNPKGKQVDLTPSNHGVAKVCFVVEDIEGMHRDLSKKGAKFVAPPTWVDGADAKGRPCKWASCMLEGPDGITLEFFESVPS